MESDIIFLSYDMIPEHFSQFCHHTTLYLSEYRQLLG